MKKEGLKISELKEILKKWQSKLSLNNWDLSIKIVEFRRKDFVQSGDIKVDIKNKKATVLLTNKPFRDEETTIVHELVHLLLWDFDHFCESKMKEASYNNKKVIDKYFVRLERTVASITKILIKNK